MSETQPAGGPESDGGEVFGSVDDLFAGWGDEAELDSPNWLGESFDELRQRGFERINDPRKRIPQ